MFLHKVYRWCNSCVIFNILGTTDVWLEELIVFIGGINERTETFILISEFNSIKLLYELKSVYIRLLLLGEFHLTSYKITILQIEITFA